ncbi:Metallo-dependent phosphatase-like protein [Tirmania nivea]|nr:Metallo-dependent phosphatase-like protein [Tirmania nivea]
MERQNMQRRGGFSMLDKRFLLLGVFLAVITILDVVHASPSPVAQTKLDVQSFPSHNSPVLPPGSGSNRGNHGHSRTKKRKLHGRFLHITDLHPDNYYVPHAPTSNACHTPLVDPTDPDKASNVLKRPKAPEDGGDGDFDTAGVYGAPASNCDSPHSLINATFDWIKTNIMNPNDDSMGIDFVVWTGDSARHDNDIQRPRTEREILSLNELMVEKMYETFGNKDGMDDDDLTNDFLVPVVPTLGNNDILPHNIFFPGPSILTREYLNLWRSFVPEDQFHTFDRGAYFWKDVVPGNKNGENDQLEHGGLAVISLNTLYFFNSNSAVDGCNLPSEPGYQQMEWLRIQLELMRQTNMKAILIGHVPPARVREVGWREGGRDDWEAGWGKRSWDETCWRKYVLWSQQYRDVIAGSIYGHMNLDHFIVMDTKELDRKHKPVKHKGTDKVVYTASDHEPTYHINSAEDYLISLREGFARLPHPGPPRGKARKNAPKGVDWNKKYIEDIGGEYGERFIVNVVGPSVIPNYFPTLRIVEYNITGVRAGFPSDDDIVETQDDTEVTQPEIQIEGELRKRNADPTKKKKKKKQPKKPIAPTPNPPSPTAPPGPAYSNQPFTLLGYTQLYANLTRINFGRNKALLEKENVDNEFHYEVEYDTRTDKKYGLKDMTVRSYLDLAHKIVDARKPDHMKKGKKEGKGKKGKKERVKGQIEENDLFDDDLDEADDEVDLARKGREHKGHRHRKGNKDRDRIFREFLNRAFVQTLNANDLDAILGIESHVIDPIDDGDTDDHRKPLISVSSMGTGRSRPLEFIQGVCREGEMTSEDELEVLHAMEKKLRMAWRDILHEDELE